MRSSDIGLHGMTFQTNSDKTFISHHRVYNISETVSTDAAFWILRLTTEYPQAKKRSNRMLLPQFNNAVNRFGKEGIIQRAALISREVLYLKKINAEFNDLM